VPKKMVLKETHTTYSLNIETSQLTQSPIVLEHEGKPIAALISLADYQRFVKWQEREQAKAWQEEQERLLHEEIAAFERIKPELLKTHKGKQVAILNGQLVDFDEDKRALAKRVYARYGYRPILMIEVRETPRVYTIDSPEIVHR
jgi:PHD/YefM family antitoxin component YafN of YafNO toxin-antitoxin module